MGSLDQDFDNSKLIDNLEEDLESINAKPYLYGKKKDFIIQYTDDPTLLQKAPNNETLQLGINHIKMTYETEIVKLEYFPKPMGSNFQMGQVGFERYLAGNKKRLTDLASCYKITSLSPFSSKTNSRYFGLKFTKDKPASLMARLKHLRHYHKIAGKRVENCEYYPIRE